MADTSTENPALDRFDKRAEQLTLLHSTGPFSFQRIGVMTAVLVQTAFSGDLRRLIGGPLAGPLFAVCSTMYDLGRRTFVRWQECNRQAAKDWCSAWCDENADTLHEATNALDAIKDLARELVQVCNGGERDTPDSRTPDSVVWTLLKRVGRACSGHGRVCE